MKRITRRRCWFAAWASVLSCCATCPAAITWNFNDVSLATQAKQDQIATAMNAAVSAYNTYSNYTRLIRVSYSDNPNLTAQGSYNGGITFGTKINDWTAMHEMGHVLGVGTYSRWDDFVDLVNKRWTGPIAIAELKEIDGANAILRADEKHFWPYGNNTAPSDDRSHVRMVGALRQDMGLSNQTTTGLLGDFDNNGRIEAADYTRWRDGAYLLNDPTPGVTNSGGDYDTWRAAFGQFASAVVAAYSVPEPSTCGSTLAIAAMVFWYWHRQLRMRPVTTVDVAAAPVQHQ